MSHMTSTKGQTILYADALDIGKVNWYIPADVSEVLAQIEVYQPVLYSILGEEHTKTIIYLQAVKYLEETILLFKEALIKRTTDWTSFKKISFLNIDGANYTSTSCILDLKLLAKYWLNINCQCVRYYA